MEIKDSNEWYIITYCVNTGLGLNNVQTQKIERMFWKEETALEFYDNIKNCPKVFFNISFYKEHRDYYVNGNPNKPPFIL